MARYRPRKLKYRDTAKVKCVKVRDNWLCAYSAKYGVSARLYAKGSSPPRDAADWSQGGRWVPVSTGKARTVKQALSAGRQSLRRVRMR